MLLTETPVSATPSAATGTQTNTPAATVTTNEYSCGDCDMPPTQPPTNTPAVQKTPTNTPTVPRSANPTATPTATPAQATATFTVVPQATDTPISGAPTALPTSTPIPAEQTPATSYTGRCSFYCHRRGRHGYSQFANT